ncbi:cysteine-rich VLP protein [uncultured Acetatifactor sp.]|uniref:cysteine-rich VLP protein n=1 Tax=uncultured Acetatifactor sp. TaxID=1671927 RepID=UPI0026034775|nr:cysteine-rich VLP protein [uncultured Acetatifactor sp.]
MNGPPSRELSRQERAAIRKQVTELCANYDSQDKSCRPLDCPCYMLHKWWTGSFCRYFREAVLPTDPALESAITGEDTSLKQKTCPVCGRAYLPTTSQAYCSDFCRTFARRKSERERKRRSRQNQG